MLIRMWSHSLVLAIVASLTMTANAKEDPNRPDAFAPDSTVSYVMAAPRACLTDLPGWAATLSWLPGGAAENFPRADGTLRVVTGTRVVFGLGERSEAVWYAGTYGTVAISLELQRQVADVNDPNKREATTMHSPSKVSWVTLGQDGAKDTRKGPSIGHGDVTVAVRFPKAGIYSLRGIIRTEARPQYTEPLDKWRERLGIRRGGKLPEIPAEVDRDTVYVKVVVVDGKTVKEEADDTSTADFETGAEQSLAEDAQGETDVSL